MSDTTHFERLGLPRRFRLDAAALEANYLARSREVHPDFTGNDPASLQASAALNEAYTTLREPFRRAEYLLNLEGGPSAARERCRATPYWRLRWSGPEAVGLATGRFLPTNPWRAVPSTSPTCG